MTERQMGYSEWVVLFGRAADEPDVIQALAVGCVTKTILINADELGVSADLPGAGITIAFRVKSLLKPNGIIGRPILYSVMMLVQHPKKRDLYTGPLPHGLSKDMSRHAVRERFGDPNTMDDEMRWDKWLVDGFCLTVTYTTDYSAIARVAIGLPVED